ncbi:MAG: hypothetical protein QOH78_2691, partial [Verrucomicrobiota bacterium]
MEREGDSPINVPIGTNMALDILWSMTYLPNGMKVDSPVRQIGRPRA